MNSQPAEDRCASSGDEAMLDKDASPWCLHLGVGTRSGLGSVKDDFTKGLPWATGEGGTELMEIERAGDAKASPGLTLGSRRTRF